MQEMCKIAVRFFFSFLGGSYFVIKSGLIYEEPGEE